MPPKPLLQVPPGSMLRDMWNSVPPKFINFGFDHPLKEILITYTETDPCLTKDECIKAMMEEQKKDMETLGDIKHNFLIGGDATVYVGRGWVCPAALPPQFADRTANMLSVAYFGRKGTPPTEDQVVTFSELISCGQNNQFVDDNPKFHEDLGIGIDDQN